MTVSQPVKRLDVIKIDLKLLLQGAALTRLEGHVNLGRILLLLPFVQSIRKQSEEKLSYCLIRQELIQSWT